MTGTCLLSAVLGHGMPQGLANHGALLCRCVPAELATIVHSFVSMNFHSGVLQHCGASKDLLHLDAVAEHLTRNAS